MRVPRLTTRRLMIVVAILALAFAAERQRRKFAPIYGLRRRLASVHAFWEQHYRRLAKATAKSAARGNTGGGRPVEPEEKLRRRAAWELEMAEYHRRWSREYAWSAWRLWEDLPPRPPRPRPP